MALVWVLLAILVLGGVAVVAAGRGQGLTSAEPDRPDLSLPPNRPLVRADVDQVRFSVGLRGYRMDEVDDVLDRLAYDLESRDNRIAVLEQEVAARWAAASTPARPTDVTAGPDETAVSAEDAQQLEEVANDGVEVGDVGEAAEAQEDDGADGGLLVARTLIVPFQETESRFARPGDPSDAPAADAPAPDDADDGPGRGA